MDKDLTELLEAIKSVPDFYGVKFCSINDTNVFGDNALHCVCIWGDITAAKLLVEKGIEINQRGEGGFTPLNMTLDFNHQELANYLISVGADTGGASARHLYTTLKRARSMCKAWLLK